MTTQEKVTLNLSSVDLGKIDYLVEQGFYSTRSDFMRTAIRNQLQVHDAVVSDGALHARMSDVLTGHKEVRHPWVVGLFHLSRPYLERHLEEGTKISLTVVGALLVDSNVTLDLAEQVIISAKIYGSATGPQNVVSFIRNLG